MAYDVTLAQVNASPGGISSTAYTQMGFPTTDWNTMLYSQWMCGPIDIHGNACGIGPDFSQLLDVYSLGGRFNLGRNAVSYPGNFFTGTFPMPALGVRHHYLMSINTLTQVIQLYIDDQPVVVSGTWMRPPGSTAFYTSAQPYGWDNENVGTSITRPGIGDMFLMTLPGDTWVDLSVVSNRRKFINADLTPVYLGPNGQFPFGTEPQIYCTIPAGSTNPNDILTNNGMGGTNFAANSPGLTFQTPGSCSLPTPPPPPPAKLAMDALLVTGAHITPTDTRIFLDWSDDRGHSFHIPVGQDIGKPGAYLTALQWQRLGYGRDRVFRLTWSAPVATALQGAWVQVLGTGKT